MIQTSDYRRINALSGQLGDLLDPDSRDGVQRAYITALNSMASPAKAADKMRDLARQLRDAAALADELAGHFPNS